MRNQLIARIYLPLAALVSLAGVGFAQEAKPPETFVANAQVEGQEAGAGATVTIRIERYTEDRHRTAMLTALKEGGYPALLPVLRKSPEVGYVEMNGRKVSVRWARQTATKKGRAITVVTESPLAFIGGAAVDAKPRAGYELAILQFEVDSIGLGWGTMAAAAKVRPGGDTGVELDDYAEKPVKLVTVRRSYARESK